jgi:hypothetical protein
VILEHPTLILAEFPESDVEPALQRSPLLSRVELRRQLDVIKAQFIAKFKYQPNPVQGPGVLSPGDTETETTRGPRTTIEDSFKSLTNFVEYDDATMALLSLCGRVSGVDPMQKAFQEFKNSTEIPRMIRELTSIDA